MNKNIYIGIILAVIIGAALIFVGVNYSNLSDGGFWPRACTKEAKLCLDGSAVGRTEQDCEFAACPAKGAENIWKTFSDLKLGVSFKYPEKLTTEYIHPIDWPPQVQIVNESFICTEGGSEIARAGKTEKRMVGGRIYCVTRVSEGAAGSIYMQYAYAASVGEKQVILTFSVRFVQCGNYDESQKTVCERERETFDIDGVIDRVMQTVTIAPISTQNKSGIQGIVLLGPICPVIKDPPDENCDDTPFETRLVVTTSDQARVVKEFSSDANGKFSVDVPPGEYAIRSAVAANILPYCAKGDIVKVAANVYAEIIVHCDTGIR